MANHSHAPVTRSPHQVLFDVEALRVEVHADADNLLALQLEGQHILFAADLHQCLLGTPVQLELHHVAVLLRLHHQVDSSSARMVLRLHIESHQYVAEVVI